MLVGQVISGKYYYFLRKLHLLVALRVLCRASACRKGPVLVQVLQAAWPNVMAVGAKVSTPIIFIFKSYASLLRTLAEEEHKQIHYETSNEHFSLNLPVNF